MLSSLISRIREVAPFSSDAEAERIISGMKWMGILSSDKAVVVGGNLLDTLCKQLEGLMSFKPGERDLVMLQHKFVTESPDGKRVQSHQCLPVIPDELTNWHRKHQHLLSSFWAIHSGTLLWHCRSA